MSADKINLLNLDHAAPEAFLVGIGEKPFRTRNCANGSTSMVWMISSAMTNLSKDLRHAPQRNSAEIRAPPIAADQLATDGTRKWQLQVDSNNAIEAAIHSGD